MTIRAGRHDQAQSDAKELSLHGADCLSELVAHPQQEPRSPDVRGRDLERGATQDRDLFDWFQDVAITSSGLGLTDVNYKRNLEQPRQQDRDGTTLCRWSLSRAWPVKFVAGDLGNEADENVIESVNGYLH